MSGNLLSLANFGCAVLIVAYAWNRFNTPASNRSTTLRRLYWWTCLGYIAWALALFVVLSLLLEVGPMRTMLLGKTEESTLPAPLIATLAMTTMLSSVPLLKKLDGWILERFHEWGEIPTEVRRRAAGMTVQNLRIQVGEVPRFCEVYGDGSYGEHLADHLRADRGDGLALSQYRLTAVVKLYDCARTLASEPRYARFFGEAAEEWDALDRTTEAFLRRAAASLTIAARLGAIESDAMYEELVSERREQFAQSCREAFRGLALFLARAVLRSEPDEHAIVGRLAAAGFVAAEQEVARPRFPVDSLTVLAVVVFLYLAMLSVVFAHLQGLANPQANPLLMASKIGLVRLGTAGMTVWLMQRFPFFSRAPGGRPRYFGYLLVGLAGVALASVLTLAFHFADPDPLAGLKSELALIGLSGGLCAALAYCCDDWPLNVLPPAWLRPAEAAGCGAVMALGAMLVWLGGISPLPLQGWMVAAWIVLPTALAMGLGGWVPHIYRAARCAASARHAEAKPVSAAPAMAAGVA